MESERGTETASGSPPPPLVRARRTPHKPQRRTQQSRSAETRRRLIAAAIEMLRREGYASLTVSKVARAAGLTNGAVQHHFASRDDLLLALLDAVYPVLRIPIDAIAAGKLDPAKRISRLIDMLTAIYGRPEYLVVWNIALGSRGDARLWPRVRAYQKEISRHMAREFVRLFPEFDLREEDAERILAIPVAGIRGVALLNMFGKEHLRYVEGELIKDLACRSLFAFPRRGGSG